MATPEQRLKVELALSDIDKAKKGLSFQKSRIGKLKVALKSTKDKSAAQAIRLKLANATDLAKRHANTIKNIQSGKAAGGTKVKKKEAKRTPGKPSKVAAGVLSKIKNAKIGDMKEFKFGKHMARVPKAGIAAVRSLGSLTPKAKAGMQKAYGKFAAFMKRKPTREQAIDEMEDTIEQGKANHLLTPKNVLGMLFIMGVMVASM